MVAAEDSMANTAHEILRTCGCQRNKKKRIPKDWSSFLYCVACLLIKLPNLHHNASVLTVHLLLVVDGARRRRGRECGGSW